MTDKLDQIFEAQQRLQRRLGYSFAEMTEPERVQYIKDMVMACEHELHEALDETSWKPWTQGVRTINRNAYIGELIDALHFLMNLFMVAGADPTEILERYLHKNEVNHQRQDAGYDGTNKCGGCRRDFDASGAQPGVMQYGKVFCNETCFDAWKVKQASA